MNILDYIEWRGDLDFEEKELNAVDSLILSVLSYENFDKILYCEDKKTTAQVAQAFFSLYDEEFLKNRVSMTNRSYELLKAAAKSKRFSSLVMCQYVNEVDEQQDLQFSAVTFCYKKIWKYVAFRGTDDTITGWKEDFAMTYRDEVLSQKKAAEYINHVLSTSFFSKLGKKCDYYIGGHSKGGNLAMYASAHATDEIRNQIVRIDNFDGPGFAEHIWEKENFQQVLPYIQTYIPAGSVFGRLFSHHERTIILKSDQVGLWQHDAFSWHVTPYYFVLQQDMTAGSQKAIIKLNGMLAEYDQKQREELIESLFKVFNDLNVHTLYDLVQVDFARGLLILHDLVLDGKSRKVLFEFLKVIWDVSEILPVKQKN